MTSAREIQDVLTGELERRGIDDWAVNRGGKHPYLVFFRDGKRHRFTFPGTPSDSRYAIHNSLGDLRRILGREEPTDRRVVPRKRARRVPSKKAQIQFPVGLLLTPGKDWREALQGLSDEMDADLIIPPWPIRAINPINHKLETPA